MMKLDLTPLYAFEGVVLGFALFFLFGLLLGAVMGDVVSVLDNVLGLR